MHVRMEHVSKSFAHEGKTIAVLRDVNLTVEQGEFVCLLGPSGSGKTTVDHPQPRTSLCERGYLAICARLKQNRNRILNFVLAPALRAN